MKTILIQHKLNLKVNLSNFEEQKLIYVMIKKEMLTWDENVSVV